MHRANMEPLLTMTRRCHKRLSVIQDRGLQGQDTAVQHSPATTARHPLCQFPLTSYQEHRMLVCRLPCMQRGLAPVRALWLASHFRIHRLQMMGRYTTYSLLGR